MVEKPGQRLLLPDPAQRELPDAGPEGRHRGAGSSRACTCSRRAGQEDAARQGLLGSGTILRESMEARKLLAGLGRGRQRLELPSFNELARRPGLRALEPAAPDRRRRAVRGAAARLSHAGPVIASTDYMKNYADQIRAFIPKGRAYKSRWAPTASAAAISAASCGALRDQPPLVVVAALKALATRAAAGKAKVAEAIKSQVRHRHREDQSAVRLNGSDGETHGIGGSEGPRHRGLGATWPSSSCWSSRATRCGRAVADHGGSDKASMEIPSSARGVVKAGGRARRQR